MKRKNKDFFIKKTLDVLRNSDFLILVNFKSISADKLLTLRSKLKTVKGGGILVVKNTLVRLALKKANKFSFLEEKFSGPVAVIYSAGIAETVKLTANFIDSNKERMSLICAAHLDRLFSAEDFDRIAGLPSIDELRAKIMRLISYDIFIQLLFSISSPFVRLLRVLSYYNSINNCY